MWATSLLFFHFTSYLNSLLLGATTAARLVKKHVQHARSHSPRHVPFLVRVKAAAQPCQSDFLAARRAQQSPPVLCAGSAAGLRTGTVPAPSPHTMLPVQRRNPRPAHH